MDFKGVKLRESEVAERLLSYYNEAGYEEISDGLLWYKDANRFVTDRSIKYEVKPFRVAGVLSALSPQKSWEHNKQLTDSFLKGSRKGHTRVQIDKAEQCLIAKKPSDIYRLLSKGQVKTSQFYLNILCPNMTFGTTIDRHAITACLYDTDNLQEIDNSIYKLTKNQYHFFSNCYKQVSQQLSVKPHEAQAIIWCTVKKLKNKEEEVPF